MKPVAVILLLVAAIVATIYNNERQSVPAAPVAASVPDMERKLETVVAVEEANLRGPAPVVVEEEPVVVEEEPVVEEPVVVTETQAAPVEEAAPVVVEEPLAVQVAETVTEAAAPLDAVEAEEAAGEGEGRHLQTGGGASGDPHFKTWKNEHFEYHGQCDMVLVSDKDFANGLGLDIHVRTKLVRYWSYIQSVSIRIGNDIMELHGSSAEFDPEVHYWYNYEFQAEVEDMAGFPVTLENRKTLSHKTSITIDLDSISPGSKILVQTYKEFLKVDFVEPTCKAFGNVVGMLGDFHTGKTFGRDGATVIDDFTDLGHEWQVLPSDGHLFHETSEPQYPALCIDPEDPRGDRQRRLAESSVKEEEAEAACASIKDPLDRKDCVYDIIATQDLDMAGAY